MEGFKFNLGDCLVHKACLAEPLTAGAWRLFVVSRHADEFYAGRQNNYVCSAVTAGGQMQKEAEYNEIELAPWDDYVQAVTKQAAEASGIGDILSGLEAAIRSSPKAKGDSK